jgi:hypothetical protein
VARRIEMVSGSLAGLALPAAVGVALILPLGTTCVGEICHPTQSAWQSGLDGRAEAAIIAAVVGCIEIAVSTYFHSRYGDAVGLFMLWLSAILLVCTAVLFGPSFGLFCVPAALLTVVAAVVGTVRGLRGETRRLTGASA